MPDQLSRTVVEVHRAVALGVDLCDHETQRTVFILRDQIASGCDEVRAALILAYGRIEIPVGDIHDPRFDHVVVGVVSDARFPYIRGVDRRGRLRSGRGRYRVGIDARADDVARRIERPQRESAERVDLARALIGGVVVPRRLIAVRIGLYGKVAARVVVVSLDSRHIEREIGPGIGLGHNPIRQVIDIIRSSLSHLPILQVQLGILDQRDEVATGVIFIRSGCESASLIVYRQCLRQLQSAPVIGVRESTAQLVGIARPVAERIIGVFLRIPFRIGRFDELPHAVVLEPRNGIRRVRRRQELRQLVRPAVRIPDAARLAGLVLGVVRDLHRLAERVVIRLDHRIVRADLRNQSVQLVVEECCLA
ncbi:hypothetical protein AWB80_04367 [Caballeronia pedi]|uniref:Uncharacterized protein n=1 Tax=Caballeronia pedi TaxID=1777141 RepID=A0A158C079_9BURK|nr:hypothetical protein AWB80_04367 [Caballeronia pedi]